MLRQHLVKTELETWYRSRGNKAAAEDTQFLVSKSITHVLNLASNTKLRFFVVPDHESLQTHGIELKEMMLRDKSDEDITRTFSESGRWIRRCLQTGGRVMVNCWQVILAQFFLSCPYSYFARVPAGRPQWCWRTW